MYENDHADRGERAPRHLWDRRDFLKVTAASMVGAALAPEILAASGADRTTTAVVAMVENSVVKTAVRDAIAMSGGLDFIKPGQTVLIKPNEVAPMWHPMTTNPEVIYEVVRAVADAGCDRIFVSDLCVGLYKDSLMVMKISRHWEAAKDAEADIGGGVKVHAVPLDQTAPYLDRGLPVWRRIHHPLAKQYITEAGEDVGFEMAELLFHVDHVINLPCCKTHEFAWFTLSLKNFVGMVSVDSRAYFHRRTAKGLTVTPGDTMSEDVARVIPGAEAIAELNLPLAPALNIIDATRPLYSGSHKGGDSVAANTIIASRDRIAADVAGVALMRSLGNEKRIHSISPWQHPMIRRARELGLGAGSRDDVTVRHEGVGNIEAILGHMA